MSGTEIAQRASMNTETRTHMTKLEDRFADDLGTPWPEFAAAPSDNRQTDLPRSAALPRAGVDLLWRIAGLVVAVVLIVVASNIVGGIAGHWIK
jgi:hypothetical protein